MRARGSGGLPFDFITSRYTNFQHHLHGFNDQTLAVASGAGVSDADGGANGGAGIDIPGTATAAGFGPVLVAEGRAFDVLEGPGDRRAGREHPIAEDFHR